MAKNSHIISIFVCIVLFLTPNAKSAEPKQKILLVGDSLAFGLARPLKKEASKYNYTLYTHSVGGTNTLQWGKKEKWLIASLQKYRPHWVFVVLGTNDNGVPYFKKNFAKHADLVVKRIHRRKAKAVWLTPPKVKFKSDFIYDGAKQAGSDIVLDFRDKEVQLWEDKIHPSIQGSTDWSRMIFEQFEEHKFAK